MTSVSAREANQQFSKILDAATRGEEIVITKRGKPVAKLVPVSGEPDESASDEAKREAEKREAILALFDKGFVGTRFDSWTRDELYDERFERPKKTDECA